MRRAVETMRWNGDALELLDQRQLPQSFHYVKCRTAAETAHAIRDMVVRGAPAIGCAAAFGVALEARRLAAQADEETYAPRLSEGFDVLRASRPTAVNLFWALKRLRHRLAHGNVGQRLQRAGREQLSCRKSLHGPRILWLELHDIAAIRELQNFQCSRVLSVLLLQDRGEFPNLLFRAHIEDRS